MTAPRKTAMAALTLLVALSGTGCSEGSRFKRDFVGSCAMGGVPESVCKCTYDRVSRTYSDEQMQAFEGQQGEAAQAYGQALMRAMRDCLD